MSAQDLESDWLTQAVNGIDFVCAALDRPSLHASPPALFLEIGAALGRGLPLLIITESRRELPLPLAGIQSVEVDFGNVEAITHQVRRFVKALEVPRPVPIVPGLLHRPATLFDARHFLADARAPESSPDSAGKAVILGYQYEEIIRSVLSHAAAQLSDPGSATGPDAGFDFAAWVDTASEILGGPILVDCIIGRRITPGRLNRAASRLADVLYKRSLYFGLIVYHNAGNPTHRVAYNSPLPVGAISALELVEKVESGSLGRALVKLRNSQIHQAQAGRE